LPDDPAPAIVGFRNAIIELAERRLARTLTPVERRFVESRGAFIALEAIWDTVRCDELSHVERYLNSERGTQLD